MTITIKRTDGRHWNGNGFGYSPSRYGVYRDNHPVGTITSAGTGYWYIHALDPTEEDGKRPDGGAYKHKDAKEKARGYFE